MGKNKISLFQTWFLLLFLLLTPTFVTLYFVEATQKKEQHAQYIHEYELYLLLFKSYIGNRFEHLVSVLNPPSLPWKVVVQGNSCEDLINVTSEMLTYVDSIQIYNPEKKLFCQSPQEGGPKHSLHDEYLNQAIIEEKPIIGSSVEWKNSLYLPFFIPIMFNGNLEGVLNIYSDTNILKSYVLDFSHSHSLSFFLADSEGKVIYSSEQPDILTEEEPDIPLTDEIFSQAQGFPPSLLTEIRENGQTITHSEIIYKKKNYDFLGASLSLQGSNEVFLYLISPVPIENYGSFQPLFSPIFIILLSVLIFSLILARYVSKNFIIQPLKELHDFAAAIALGQRTFVKKDTYRVTELHELQESMIKMQDQIEQRELSLLESLAAEQSTKEELLLYKDQLESRILQRTMQLNIARDEAVAASKAKSQFLANMSHEIRTPMNAVLGMAYLCLQTELNCQQKNYIQKIHSAALNLLGIINDVLDVSKIDAGKMHLEHTPFSLKKVIEDVFAIQEVMAQTKNLTLSYSYVADLAPAYFGDPLRIRQILLNLISNGIKFTREGKVHLTLLILPQEKTEEESKNSDLLLFKIEDTGIGISKSKLSTLFEPFIQGDSSFTRTYGGTGLGLTICKQLVELMGGTIWVDSEENKGTAFFFTLKLEKEVDISDTESSFSVPCKDQEYTQQQIKEILKNKRVLLVEDNLINQEIAKELLGMMEINVTLAENGSEALNMWEEGLFDLILMDIQMPEMDGLTATRILREKGCTLPIIAMTAHAGEEDKERSLEAGMNSHLTKPLDPRLLHKVLAKYIGEANE